MYSSSVASTDFTIAFDATSGLGTGQLFMLKLDASDTATIGAAAHCSLCESHVSADTALINPAQDGTSASYSLITLLGALASVGGPSELTVVQTSTLAATNAGGAPSSTNEGYIWTITFSGTKV
jgi:hypothetical protein